jgi:GAF domain-containing protein
MPAPTPELRALLAAQAERLRHELDVTLVAVSRWERDRGRLRTLLNVGRLDSPDEAFPEEEVYPLDTFPATDALLRFGRPYVDPADVASPAVLAQMRLGSQAAVPLVVEGAVWGELWAATAQGGRALRADDILTLTRGAEAVGRTLAGRDRT